ncbi:MAG: hypothetical protein Q3966_07755 [Neisseria sp.]|nr:hypothetical protein [Neisseria sp.]
MYKTALALLILPSAAYGLSQRPPEQERKQAVLPAAAPFRKITLPAGTTLDYLANKGQNPPLEEVIGRTHVLGAKLPPGCMDWGGYRINEIRGGSGKASLPLSATVLTAPKTPAPETAHIP